MLACLIWQLGQFPTMTLYLPLSFFFFVFFFYQYFIYNVRLDIQKKKKCADWQLAYCDFWNGINIVKRP